MSSTADTRSGHRRTEQPSGRPSADAADRNAVRALPVAGADGAGSAPAPAAAPPGRTGGA